MFFHMAGSLHFVLHGRAPPITAYFKASDWLLNIFYQSENGSELYCSSKLNWSSKFNSVFFVNSVANSSSVHLTKTELELPLNSPMNFFELSSKSIQREWSARL